MRQEKVGVETSPAPRRLLPVDREVIRYYYYCYFHTGLGTIHEMLLDARP